MHTVRPSAPHQTRSQPQVSRTESLRSERSDKRVSFNKDVGVKHIPRGAQKTTVRISPNRDDEWANCSQVHREPVSLSSRELEQQAEHLVKLLDHVNCDVNTRSLDRPSKNKNSNTKNLAHHTYNNVLFNNVKNTNVINGENRGRPRDLPASRTTNPINRRIKGDVNRTRAHHPLPNGGPLSHRHRSADHLPDTELEDSPPLPRRGNHLAAHKSVPDLYAPYSKREGSGQRENNFHHVESRSSNLSRAAPASAYKSVDNLVDGSSQAIGSRLQGFKSVGNLPSAAISETDDDFDQYPLYKPRVGKIIKKFNKNSEEVPHQPLTELSEMEPGQRGTLEPDRYRNHNNNQPFSYTGTSPLASVQTVRRLSPPRDTGRPTPPRDTGRPTPPRDTPPREAPVYAQVNKRDGRPPHASGRREMDRNYHNSRQEREYSAKIIITEDDLDRHRSPYHDPYDDHYHDTPPKNQYQDDDDDDDDAYESYQVPEDNLRRLIHDDLEEYKEHFNNNINMSSVGVQTESLPKAPTRSRPRSHKSPAPSPTRTPIHNKQPVQKQAFRQQEQPLRHQEQKQQPPSYHQSKQQNYFPHQEQQRGRTSIHNNLTSATLVRQVNHGFGRTDRSPSPPPRVSATRQPRRNVVPLLSDTSDSEGEYRGRTVDPLARIRDQVMQREKLQEEEEEEEEATVVARLRRPPLQESSTMPYRAEEMTPLTIDEVDALSLVMEDTGRKSLVVSNQAQSTTVTRVSNHRSRHTETITERHHTTREPITEHQHTTREPIQERHHSEPREKDSLSRPQKPLRDKNHASREATPTRKGRDTPTHKEQPTLEKKKNNLEKNKKNNLEKERVTKAAAKQKEEKKKKKRIKIKFFYDPRPQDDPDVDPLANFTEFRGTSSDERASPRNDRTDLDDTRDDPVKRRSEEREISGGDDYRRRDLPDVLEDATPIRELRVESRERLDTTPRAGKRGQRDNARERSYDSYDYKRRGSKDSRDSRDNRSRSRDDHTPYDDERDERRNNYERTREYDHHDEEDEVDERGSPDGRPGRSLSDKYRTGPLYDPPDDPHLDDHQDDHLPQQPQPPSEEEEKKEKTNRQRNKFLSALMSDSRNKSSTTKTKTSNTKSSSNTNTNTNTNTSKSKSKDPSPAKKTKKGPAPPQPSPPPPQDTPEKSKTQGQSPWFTKERQQQREREQQQQQQQGLQHQEEEGKAPPPPWQTSTLSRAELRERRGGTAGDATVESRGYSTVQRPTRKYSAESSASSVGPPPPPQVARTTSFKHRYFGDTDIESNHGGMNAVGDYRSLPNRSSRSAHKSAGRGRRTASGPRGMSPPVVGSAGSSLQSSESEVDSHGGSHASRASKASKISTGSNKSVYLHATAIADIPVRRGPEDAPSERSVSRQTKKVSRSFSLLAPWKPRHYREKFEVEYDNKEVRDARSSDHNASKGALPPRPPRRPVHDPNDKTVNRSQSVYKDSRLATWLRRRRNKEAKGI